MYLLGTINDKHAIDKTQQWRFDQQRHGDYLVYTVGRLRLAPNFGTDSGMENGLEIGSSIIVRKNETSHCRSIKSTRLVEYVIAKPLSYRFKRGFTGLNHLARDYVGIDYVSAKIEEQVGNSRLAAGDAAGQADSESVLFCGFGHSEHQVKIDVLNRLTPQHRDPASGGQIRAKRDWDTSILAACHDHDDVDDRAYDRRHHDNYG